MSEQDFGRALREPALGPTAPEPASGLRPTGDDPARGTVVVLKTKYEPLPFWHHIGRRWFIAAYFRPADIGAGIQFMWGGVAFICWPFMLAICDHRRMVAAHSDSDRSGEAGETPQSGATEGESAGRQASPKN